MTLAIDTPSNMTRRLLSISYDLILLFGTLFLATLLVLPFAQGNAIDSGNKLYACYLIVCSYFYFVWHWTHGGQTLGMRAWRIRLICQNGKIPDWQAGSQRFLLASLSWIFLGAGFLWVIFDPDKLTFHDRYSKTRLLKIKKTS